MKYYTGVGSRNISESEKKLIHKIAIILAEKGYTLRSGKADGADLWFALGARAGNNGLNAMDNYIPWKSFNSKLFAYNEYDVNIENLTNIEYYKKEAASVHPKWNKIKNSAAGKFHTRNICQVIGHEKRIVSDFVLACADEDETGTVIGGTRTAWVYGKRNGAPTFNIRGKTFEECMEFLEKNAGDNFYV